MGLITDFPVCYSVELSSPANVVKVLMFGYEPFTDQGAHAPTRMFVWGQQERTDQAPVKVPLFALWDRVIYMQAEGPSYKWWMEFSIGHTLMDPVNTKYSKLWFRIDGTSTGSLDDTIEIKLLVHNPNPQICGESEGTSYVSQADAEEKARQNATEAQRKYFEETFEYKKSYYMIPEAPIPVDVYCGPELPPGEEPDPSQMIQVPVVPYAKVPEDINRTEWRYNYGAFISYLNFLRWNCTQQP